MALRCSRAMSSSTWLPYTPQPGSMETCKLCTPNACRPACSNRGLVHVTTFSHPVRRIASSSIAILASVLVPALALAGPPRHNVVVLWNQAALDAIRTTRTSPPVAARAMAVTHTCMFDAWAAYDDVAVGTRL